MTTSRARNLSEEWEDASLHLVPARSRSRPFRVSFGVFLAVLMSGAAVLGSVIVAVLLYSAIATGNLAFAEDLQNVTGSGNVIAAVQRLALQPAVNIYSLGQHMALEARSSPEYVSQRSTTLQRALFAHSLAHSDGVSAGFADGTRMGYGNRLEFINTTMASDGTFTLETFPTSPTLGIPIGNASSARLNYDARLARWYMAAAAVPPSQAIIFTHIRFLTYCQCVGVSVARAIYRGSTLLGVLATGVRLDSVSAALNQTRLGKDGEVFIVDAAGSLVALSNPKRLNISFTTLIPALSIPDPLLHEAVTYAVSNSLPQGSFGGIPNIRFRIVTLAQRDYMLSTFKAAAGLNWTAILVIPRDNYFTVSDVAVRQSLIISLSMVAALIIIAIITSILLLTLPLRRLARNMRSVGQTLTAPAMSRRGSFIDEVNSMEKAYGNMAAGIHSFSKYVPGPVVRQLLQEARDPKVGVSSRTCTFFFSDIVGFTSVSEVLSEAQLSIVLTEYFGTMENILHELSGITTDFLGDGIFVFWNAPSIIDRHQHLACEAALRQLLALRDLCDKWEARGFPAMQIRVGINTGPCLVGNFGSSNHMKYTVMGDAVNVASRLEQLNKLFETRAIIGTSTYEAVKDEYLCRVLDVVVLKGKSAPTRVYELVCRQREATPEQLQLAAASAQMLDLFLLRDFAGAIAVAAELLQLHPGDKPCTLLLERCCAASAQGPLPLSWVSARELTEK